MKESMLKEILESNPSSRLSRWSEKERRIRKILAMVFKVERKLTNKWIKAPNILNNIEESLKKVVNDWEKESRSRLLKKWYGTFSWENLEFLDNLSDSDLLKINSYNMHWMRRIFHSSSDEWWNTSSDHPYFPKYTFLYEIVKNNLRVSEKIKSELKEKAKAEVWKMICDEIKNDTILYDKPRWFVEHIFEYIPQKVFANKLRWTWNMWTETNVDVLIRHIDLFTELDEDYKKEIRREYNKQHGIVYTDEKQISESDEDEGVDVSFTESHTWDEALDNFINAKKDDIINMQRYLKKRDRDRFGERFEWWWWLERLLRW